MGLRGPRPLPAAVSRLRGTFRKDRAPVSPAQPVGGIPACPQQLDDEARREWRKVSKELFSLGLLTKIDKAALSGYCQAWSDWVEALDKLKVEGKVFKSPNGYPVLSPWISIASKANEQMRAYLSEFGMSPATRARVEALPVPTARAQDAKRRLLFGDSESKLSKYLRHSQEDEAEKEKRFFGDVV
jgi:P27 family predicted phage terminase small subunit